MNKIIELLSVSNRKCGKCGCSLNEIEGKEKMYVCPKCKNLYKEIDESKVISDGVERE